MAFYSSDKGSQSMNVSSDVNCVILDVRDNLNQRSRSFFNPTPDQAIRIGNELIERAHALIAQDKRRDELARQFTGYAEAEFWKCKIALRRAIDYAISLEGSK